MRVYLPSDALPVLAWKPKEKDMRSGDDHEDENGRCNDRDEMLFFRSNPSACPGAGHGAGQAAGLSAPQQQPA